MLNRTLSPEFKPVGNINFIRPIARQLDNGIPVYILNGIKQEMVRVEFLVANVNYDPANPLKTMALSSLLKNGTDKLSAREIAEMIDYYGAFLDAEYGADQITVTLYSLNKHLPSVLPLLKTILTESVFPQSELDIYKRNNKQKLQVNMQKNDFVARKNFAHALFGNTAYGADVGLDDYDRLTREDLTGYYRTAFVPENYKVIASGNFNDEEFDLLNKLFGNIDSSHEELKANKFEFGPSAGQKIIIERPEALQSAIRLGMVSINRNDADFAGLSILSCVLGGYFGSRLMANIREDKGYTYGIGSAVIPMKLAGQFYIATEVGTSVCSQALTEIYKEIETLRTELIPEEELDLVRNYMLGSLLGSLENIFSHADKFKNLLNSGLDYDYYERYIQTVQNITPAELNLLAKKYFRTELFTELVVGKMN